MLRILFSINRDSKQHPDVPSLGDFYAGFLADVKSYAEPDKKEKRGIAKTQTWQEQKAILLNWAAHMAAQQALEQRRAAKAKRK